MMTRQPSLLIAIVMLAMAKTEGRKTAAVTCVVPAVETLVLTWKLLSVSSILWSRYAIFIEG